MRVGILVSRFPNPSETWIEAQIEGLLARGVEVDVAALAAGSEERRAALRARWGGALTIHDIPVPKSFLQRLFMMPGALGRASRAAMDRRFGEDSSSLRLLIAASRWPEALKAPRAWLAHYGRWGRFACALRDLGLIAGPVATMFHGRDMSVYLRKHPDAYGRLFRQGDLFLPISDMWRDKLIALGAPADRTKTQRLGVDINRFSYTARTASPGDEIVFVGVGRFVEKKGFDDAIAAFDRLGNIDASLTLIGDGPLRGKLEAQARGRNVHFTGLLPHDRVAQALRGAHVFVLPSRVAADGDMEGIPVALMEAMAQGLPVITTRHSGIPELVEDGASGLLCAEHDVVALGAAMVAMAREPQRWGKMGAAGAARVRAEFDAEKWDNLLKDRLSSLS